MFSKFFIDRPIFASVISIVIVLVGLISIPMLPVEKTPDIAPPTIMIMTSYPGASAEVIADTVITPLEESINGVDDMLYMSSDSSDNGTGMIMITFKVGTDIDIANVLVQNRVSQAEPLLPEEVVRNGITIRKRSSNISMLLGFYSPDGRYDDIYLSNFINLKVKDAIARSEGVGEIEVFGSKDYGMRIWLDPTKLRARGVTANDVVSVIRQQNIQVAAGQIGGMPSPDDQQFQYTIKTLGRLSTVEQFEDIIVRNEPGGRLLRVGDLARVELGSQDYFWSVKLNGEPAVAVAIYATPGANALEVVKGVRNVLEELSPSFPEGVAYSEPYNPTLFVEESIKEVFWTLLSVIGLVVLTVFVFLEDWRATLIPAVTIPVSLIGTMAVLLSFGMTVNTLSLFGLVLAIGIVVDDAVVVVENCVRIITDEKLPPREAAIKAMKQVTGPVVATTLVLLAVFVPTILSGGITGKLYQQFAITLSVAVCFSTLNALTLSPALCSVLLHDSSQKHGKFFGWFDRLLRSTTSVYANIVKVIVRRTLIVLLLFAIFTVLAITGFGALPTGFLPDEDEGLIMIGVRLPDGATVLRTEQVMGRINAIMQETEGVANYAAISGFSLLDSAIAPNGGACFVTLEPWEKRQDPNLHASKIAQRLQAKLSQIPDALCLALQPPPIQGLGMAGGFEVQIQDRGGAGVHSLAQMGNDFVHNAMNDEVITRLNSTLQVSVPQLYIDVDRTKVETLDVPLNSVFSTLQTFLGSTYVNDFNIYGRTFKVIAQAEPRFRDSAEDIGELEVRNRTGQMLPIKTLATVKDISGPQSIKRYNMYPSTTITGVPKPGYSSGQAIERVRKILDEQLPPSMGYEWSGMSLQEIEAGGKTVYIFLLAALFAYLFLAAQYESWAIPLAIVLAVPLGLLGAVGYTWLRMMDNNIYMQMGVVLLVGVVCKTAILLVEFAKQLHEEDGHSIHESAVLAARLRFRPILMTAFTTALGMLPLVVATGAGATARQALGTSVFGGMVVATLLGVFMIPVFYVAVQSSKEKAIELEHHAMDAIHHYDKAETEWPR
ncbi:Efflux pump membrane transporter BepG [Limihaloglobus sulfuriphilus]|uniref:Efflux pump membrane transporter BepG n=1 Tax=Limihaloglobus sulfuriphilus TaxID=1851148 RepID=A0A1Q2MAK0_9BACT|nr:multidrug efflux RND transporter permease subunit [Limihaloglobus sulfuriphilus]AQQ69690.1 Efflux pump membrane transporter BepG [Limihaloglobus sulfuriphilus]